MYLAFSLCGQALLQPRSHVLLQLRHAQASAPRKLLARLKEPTSCGRGTTLLLCLCLKGRIPQVELLVQKGNLCLAKGVLALSNQHIDAALRARGIYLAKVVCHCQIVVRAAGVQLQELLGLAVCPVIHILIGANLLECGRRELLELARVVLNGSSARSAELGKLRVRLGSKGRHLWRDLPPPKLKKSIFPFLFS